jgi:hypothetical protein
MLKFNVKKLFLKRKKVIKNMPILEEILKGFEKVYLFLNKYFF